MCFSSPQSFSHQIERYKSYNQQTMPQETLAEVVAQLGDVPREAMRTPAEITKQLKERKMVRYYEHVGDIWAYYNPEEAANQDRLTDDELNVAENLFGLMWSRRPGGTQKDGSRFSYCANTYELAKCLLRHVVDSNEPRYQKALKSHTKSAIIEKMVTTGLGDFPVRPSVCSL